MTRRTAVLGALGISLLCAPAASAEPVVLGSGIIGVHYGIGGPEGWVTPGTTPVFWVELVTRANPAMRPRLFNVPLTTGDIGRTLQATRETDRDFGAAAAILTNGLDDWISSAFEFRDGRYSTHFQLENAVFRGWEGTVPDFQGFALTALTFRLLMLDIQETTSTRDVRYSGVFSVEGVPSPAVIPEPATLLLVGAGGLVLGRRLRARGRTTDVPVV